MSVSFLFVPLLLRMSWWDSVLSSPLKDAVAKNMGNIMSDVERAIGIPDDADINKEVEGIKQENEKITDQEDLSHPPLTNENKEEEETDSNNIQGIPEEWNWDEENPLDNTALPQHNSEPPTTEKKEEIEENKTVVNIEIPSLPIPHPIEPQEREITSTDERPVPILDKEDPKHPHTESPISLSIKVNSSQPSEVEAITQEEYETPEEKKIQAPAPSPNRSEGNIDKIIAENKQLRTIVAKMKKKLASRESQIESISTMASQVNEENHKLKDSLNELQKAPKSKESEENLEQLTKEFTERLGKEQKTIHDLKQQIIQLKKVDKTSSDQQGNKDALIEELRQEGVTLSKKQLQLEQIIKQLRSKEKEAENQITALTDRANKAETSAEENALKVKQLTITTKSSNDTISHLKKISEANGKKLEKQEQTSKEANSRVTSLEAALEKAWKDLAEQRKINLGKETQAEQSVFEAESAVKEEFTSMLRQQQAEAQERETALSLTIEELRNEWSRVEAKYFRNEEILRQELHELQMRYKSSNDTLDTIQDTEALQALHREIESIRTSQEANRRVWNSLEQILRERIKEEEEKLEDSLQAERIAQAELNNATLELKKVESKLTVQRSSYARLSAEQETTLAALEEVQTTCEQLNIKLEKLTERFNTSKQSAEAEKSQLEQKLLNLQEIESSLRTQLAIQKEIPSVAPVSSFSNTSRSVPMRSQSSLQPLATLPSGMKSSAAYERMQSSIKQQESEVHSLRDQINRLEKAKVSLEDQLVKLTASNDHYIMEMEQLKEMKNGYTELENRHKLLMELYGAKEETVEELRDDIKEMKQLYQMQINELLVRIEALNK